jgi:tetratricopeptide (TPR) repeat protein
MSSVDAAFARAERAAKSGDWPKARKHFKLVLRRQPDNVDALFQLARVYMQESRLGPALPLLAKAIGLAPKAAVLHQTQGTALLMSGDHQAAVEALERCLALDRELPGAWNNLGNAYLQLDSPEQARAAFEQAVERSPQAVGIRTNLVRCAMRTKDYEEVLALCRAGLATHPHDNRLLALEAEALHQLGRLDNSPP